MQHGLKIVLLVVNHNIRAEAFYQIAVRRACCRRDGRANVLRQLNRKCAHATGARLNKNFLPFLQIRFFNQRLPGGQAHQRN